VTEAGHPIDRAGAVPYPRISQAIWLLVVLTLLNVASTIDRQILALMVDDVKDALSISDFEISLLQGLTFATFYTLFGLPFGWAADRFSRHRVIFIGVTLWSIAASACGLARHFWQLLIARIGVGIGEAALSPAAFSLISDSFPKARLALALSIYSTGAVVGSALALAIGGVLVGVLPKAGMDVLLLGSLARWQIIYLVTGLPCLLVGWLIFTTVNPVRRGRIGAAAKGNGAARFMAQRWRVFGPHFLGFGLYSMCGYGILIWTPAYMNRVFGWDMLIVGPLTALMMLTGVFGGSLLGAIADRWFARGTRDAHMRLYSIAALIQPVIVLVAISVDNPYAFLALYGGYHVMSSFTGVATAVLHIVTPNEYRGQVSATFLLSFNLLGLGVGPSVVAFLTTFVFADPKMVGWSIVLTFALFMPLASLLLRLGCAPVRREIDALAAIEASGVDGQDGLPADRRQDR
jgi:MFS family permease